MTRVKVRRSTGPDMVEVIRDLSDLTYTGNISTTAEEGIWYPTTQGEMMQYATPSRNRPVKLEEAVKLCKDQGGHLWDESPQLGVGFSNIKYNENYWISSEDGSMAKYTITSDTPEIVYDDMCTQIKVKTLASEGLKPEIEVKTVFDTSEDAEAIQGCKDEAFTGLTLCLRPVKNFDYANNHDYRQDQEETLNTYKPRGSHNKTTGNQNRTNDSQHGKNKDPSQTTNNQNQHTQHKTGRPKTIPKL